MSLSQSHGRVESEANAPTLENLKAELDALKTKTDNIKAEVDNVKVDLEKVKVKALTKVTGWRSFP